MADLGRPMDYLSPPLAESGDSWGISDEWGRFRQLSLVPSQVEGKLRELDDPFLGGMESDRHYKPITISELAELARQIEYRRLLGYPIPRPRSPIGCRKCLNLNYRSQQATKVSPLERLERLDKSKAKLLKMMVKLGRE